MDRSFVGRHSELGRLEDRLSSTRSDTSTTVLIEAAAGMGKSAVLAAFVAGLRDVTLLTATGDEDETDLEFGVCNQLLGTTMPWRDPFSAGAEVLRLVSDQPDGAPVVLVLDDAHLADVMSLRAVTFALRRLRGDRVMALIAAREDDLARLPPGLLRIVDEQDGRLRLPGLSVAEVVELGLAQGRGQLSRSAAERLREHSRGSPLHLRALLAEL
jgi:hypothetical protein